jgi:hypothetical protein
MALWPILGPYRKAVLPSYRLINETRSEVSHLKANLKRYFGGDLDGEIADLIRNVAMNPTVSQDVITLVQSRMGIARKKYLRLVLTTGSIGLLPHLVALLLLPFTNRPFMFLLGYQLAGRETDITNSLFFWILAASFWIQAYSTWRSNNGLGYIGNRLIKALRCGLAYFANPTDSSLRDEMAASLQRVAAGYSVVFRRSIKGPRFYTKHIRSVARGCRNDILGLVLAVATADRGEVSTINGNLARLIIRSQTGYWYQTEDLVKAGGVVAKSDSIKITVLTFLKDRSIQVALIALMGVIISAFFAPIILGRSK